MEVGAKSFISAAVRMPRVRRSLLLGATGQKSCAGQEEDTHIGLERRPRLPFLPMTGVPKCSGLVRGSLSSVCGGQTTQPQHEKAKMNAAAAEPTARHQTVPFINCGGPPFQRGTARYSLRSPQSDALLSGRERNASGSSRHRRQTLQT